MCVERYISLPSLHSRALTHSLELLQPQAHKITQPETVATTEVKPLFESHYLRIYLSQLARKKLA